MCPRICSGLLRISFSEAVLSAGKNRGCVGGVVDEKKLWRVAGESEVPSLLSHHVVHCSSAVLPAAALAAGSTAKGGDWALVCLARAVGAV